jgi:hypothetical protein
MKRSIPVTIGLHSGVGVPDGQVEFKDEEAEERFTSALVNGQKFFLSASVQRAYSTGDVYRLMELRLIPEPIVLKTDVYDD